jgi:hypothetical protein|nr:MAG TPA: hypothetical protein [Caudoviricetes sp.]
MIDIADTLSYFEAFKECDIFLTGEMMDWYYRMMKTYSDGLVAYWREGKALKLNKWTQELEDEWIRRNK